MKNGRRDRLKGGLIRFFLMFGFDLAKLKSAVIELPAVLKERRTYETQRSISRQPLEFPIVKNFFIFDEKNRQAGEASGHYFHQDLHVARKIYRRNPKKHVDVGSSIYGFVSHVATFREIELLDIRPLDSEVTGIKFRQVDVMAIPEHLFDYTDSLSCLHALEHFGLGRYADPIEYEGWRKGLANLTKLLTKGGTFYLSLPTGEHQRVEFNAHRIFSIPFLRAELETNFHIEELSFVADDGTLRTQVDPYSSEADKSFGAHYGCSIWTLQKR